MPSRKRKASQGIADGQESDSKESKRSRKPTSAAIGGAEVGDGVSQRLLDFLVALRKNNNKEFMDMSREWYQSSKEEFTRMVTATLEQMQTRDPSLAGLVAKDNIKRINKDQRFAKDRSKPYNDSFTALLCPGGKKSGNAGYFLSISPEGVTIAAGCYSPTPHTLRRLRTVFSRDSEGLEDALNGPSVRKIFSDGENAFRALLESGDQLKRIPTGFEKGHKDADLLRCTRFVLSRAHKVSGGDDLVSEAVEIYEALVPFVTELNRIIMGAAHGRQEKSET